MLEAHGKLSRRSDIVIDMLYAILLAKYDLIWQGSELDLLQLNFENLLNFCLNK